MILDAKYGVNVSKKFEFFRKISKIFEIILNLLFYFTYRPLKIGFYKH